MTAKYPTAVQSITDAGVWEAIRTRSDEIGYCCFRPTGANEE